jgi:hypothetical protein
MSFEEKVTWVNAVVTTIVAVWYGIFIAGQLDGTPVAEIAYQTQMLIAVGAMVVLTIVGTIGMSIATAIGAAIVSSAKGEESPEDAANRAVADIDRKDERDVHIGWRGDRAGYWVTSALMIGVLALAMLRYDQFWIANSMFASFVVAGLTAAVVKIVAYRRGF